MGVFQPIPILLHQELWILPVIMQNIPEIQYVPYIFRNGGVPRTPNPAAAWYAKSTIVRPMKRIPATVKRLDQSISKHQ